MTTTTTARQQFDRGFHAGVAAARIGRHVDVEQILREDGPHYACGFSRGQIWFAAAWQTSSTDDAWSSYVAWIHEACPRMAAELVELEEIPEAVCASE